MLRHCVLGALMLTACATDEPGKICTLMGCSSTFELVLTHNYTVDEPISVDFSTSTLPSVECSIGPEPTGTGSCFGHRFTDLRWTEGSMHMVLTHPFFVTDDTPNAEPWSDYTVHVQQEGRDLLHETFSLTDLQPQHPNGAGCAPTCYQIVRTHAVP